MQFEWDDKKREATIRKHGVDFADMTKVFDGRPSFTYRSAFGDEERWATVAELDGKFYIVVIGLSSIAGLAGKRVLLAKYEEAMRRRYADPEAPRPYPGWRKTIIPGVPEPKAQLSVSVDRDVLDWFRSTGPDFEERINRALREFMQTHRDGTG